MCRRCDSHDVTISKSPPIFPELRQFANADEFSAFIMGFYHKNHAVHPKLMIYRIETLGGIPERHIKTVEVKGYATSSSSSTIVLQFSGSDGHAYVSDMFFGPYKTAFVDGDMAIAYHTRLIAAVTPFSSEYKYCPYCGHHL